MNKHQIMKHITTCQAEIDKQSRLLGMWLQMLQTFDDPPAADDMTPRVFRQSKCEQAIVELFKKHNNRPLNPALIAEKLEIGEQTIYAVFRRDKRRNDEDKRFETVPTKDKHIHYYKLTQKGEQT